MAETVARETDNVKNARPDLCDPVQLTPRFHTSAGRLPNHAALVSPHPTCQLGTSCGDCLSLRYARQLGKTLDSCPRADQGNLLCDVYATSCAALMRYSDIVTVRR